MWSLGNKGQGRRKVQTDEQYHEERAAALDAILASGAPRKVIVAGPGCGKTHTFGEVLKRSEGKNLVLTFINNLASDLQDDLGGYADVYTFHKFSRILLHTLPVENVTSDVDYYPPLREVFVEDIAAIDGVGLAPQEIDDAFHNLDESTSIIEGALRSGTYYNAVAHTDAVYRVLLHLVEHGSDAPQYMQIVVDEYQDFSHLEVQFIDILAERTPTLVAGDDDQALYAFKQASPEFLRSIAADEAWERFELPFCSRCPPALVEATQRIVKAAQRNGRLTNRLDKRFVCFLPAKRDEAEKYPTITHARCTVQRKNAPYMSRYVADEIGKIAVADIEASRRAGNPTVLVIGANPFLGQIGEHLVQTFPNVEIRQRGSTDLEILDGYLRLLQDEASRLGWRIVMSADDPPGDTHELLARCIPEDRELRDELATEYIERHLRIVDSIRTLKEEGNLSAPEQVELEGAVGVTPDELLIELGVVEAEPQDDLKEDEDLESPSIICTTLVGAKGLQAEHVFVVGISETHLPRIPQRPTDGEVCQFLVALTRAKKSCTIVTCNRLGNQELYPSILINWLGDLVVTRAVDKTYF